MKPKISLSAGERFLFGSALSLILLSYSILGFGLIGKLSVVTITVVAALVFGLFLVGIVGAGLKPAPTSMPAANSSDNHMTVTAVALAAITGFAVLSGILAPETAHDSLCYHLHVPKIFLRLGRIERIPYEVNSLFPFFMEMLDMIGIAWKQMPIAKAFHAMTALLGTGAVFLISRHQTSKTAAVSAALLFITTPGIVNQMGTSYVDISLTGFTALSLYAYVRWFESRETGWALLSGLMIGAALSIKFLALIGMLALFLLFVYDNSKSQKKNFKPLLIFILAASLISGYWYLRSWIELGNPVYPYFYQIFKSGDPAIHYDDIGVKKTLFKLIQIPWLITMKPQMFEGFGDNIGPAYLAFVPLGFLPVLRNPILRRVGFFGVFYLVLWFLLGQSLRFLFPALPAFAILLAVGLHQAFQSSSRLVRGGIQAAVIAVLFIHSGLALYHYRGTFKAAVGLEKKEDYLRRLERTYAVADYVNKNLPLQAKILNDLDVRMFYFDRPIVREDVYSQVTGYKAKTQSPEKAREWLKKDGFTHLLWVDSDKEAERQNFLASNEAPLYTHQFKERDGSTVTYSLSSL